MERTEYIEERRREKKKSQVNSAPGTCTPFYQNTCNEFSRNYQNAFFPKPNSRSFHLPLPQLLMVLSPSRRIKTIKKLRIKQKMRHVPISHRKGILNNYSQLNIITEYYNNEYTHKRL